MYNLVDLHQISEKYIAFVFKVHIMNNLFRGIHFYFKSKLINSTG